MTTPETIPTQNNLPDLDRLSVLTAVVFLAYVTQRLFVLPVWRTELVLLGSEFAFQVDTQLVIGVLLAGLMLTGANWLFHDHPEIANQILLAHLLLPVLAASMLSVMLGQLPFNALWWVSLLAGIVLVVFVLVAEYISIGKNDRRQPFAVAVLTAVEFMLFFAAITILRGSEVRLYQLLPLVFLAAGGGQPAQSSPAPAGRLADLRKPADCLPRQPVRHGAALLALKPAGVWAAAAGGSVWAEQLFCQPD